jgi:hypothetical protein
VDAIEQMTVPAFLAEALAAGFAIDLFLRPCRLVLTAGQVDAATVRVAPDIDQINCVFRRLPAIGDAAAMVGGGGALGGGAAAMAGGGGAFVGGAASAGGGGALGGGAAAMAGGGGALGGGAAAMAGGGAGIGFGSVAVPDAAAIGGAPAIGGAAVPFSPPSAISMRKVTRVHKKPKTSFANRVPETAWICRAAQLFFSGTNIPAGLFVVLPRVDGRQLPAGIRTYNDFVSRVEAWTLRAELLVRSQNRTSPINVYFLSALSNSVQLQRSLFGATDVGRLDFQSFLSALSTVIGPTVMQSLLFLAESYQCKAIPVYRSPRTNSCVLSAHFVSIYL